MASIPIHLTALAAAKRKPRKRLRFRAAATVRPIICRMTREEHARSYYSMNELKTLALKVKAFHTSASGDFPDVSSARAMAAEDCLVGLEADDALRGLELQLFPVRAINKVLAKKTLLKYLKQLDARSNRTSEEKLRALAAASAKLSQWSRSVALETARLDSLRARGGDRGISIDEPVAILPFPVTAKRRRDAPIEDDSEPAKQK